MVHRARIIVSALVAASLATGVGAGAAAAQADETRCSLGHGLGYEPTPVHMSPGGTGSMHMPFGLWTYGSMGDRTVGDLPGYQWRLGPSQLATISPDRGTVPFTWRDINGDGERFSANWEATIDLHLTAGDRPGAENVSLLVYSADEGAVPDSCKRFTTELLVTVGADYLLTASTTVEPPDGGMTTYGNWFGAFRIVDGDRIEGDGTITTTLVGSCVRGTGANPMRISGSVEGDMLHVTIVGEESNEEPETEADESDLRCIVQTLRELPGFFAAWGQRAQAVAAKPCPLQVPVAGGEKDCADVTFTVTRVGGN